MKPRILIVDDNPTNLRLATDILADAGCEVLQAGDAEQAQAMLAEFMPDLILMDIALPGMDGLTLTRKLKADDRFRRIPIVALTASAMKGDEEKAIAAGCLAYITKPIDTRRFAATVLGFLGPDRVKPTGGNVILIVDDYPENRLVLRAALESEGLVVHEAANGAEALEAIRREHIDAVISDILMPVMDGFRLCHEIRKGDSAYAGLPFILYTSTYNSPSDRELAKTIGADGYVSKPAPVSVIMDALRAATLRPKKVYPGRSSQPDDSYVLTQYNAALVQKLEERNADLQQAMATLEFASNKIHELNQNLEERVAQRTAELEAANKALDSFTQSVAHDLRAPLGHISLNAELLEEKAGSRLDAPSREKLAAISAACGRMSQLIDDLLDYSRAGRVDLQPALVELDVVLDEALKAVQPETAGRNVAWSRVPLPAVRGDHAMLRQVFINLLSNAVKYSRGREVIRIEIGPMATDTKEVVVYVRDNGIGFDMSRAGELFKVFHRLDPKGDIEGTGIGLASAHQVIVRHGGRMWVDAVVDHGATFFFSLPILASR